MQHMIYSIILAGSFKRGDILGTFHHTNGAGISCVIAANWTKFLVGQILTAFAVVDVFLCIKQCLCKCFHLLFRLGDDVVCKPLCGLHANSRQPCELFRQQNQR